MSKKHPKIVTLGGGTGTFVMLSGLRRHPVWPVAVVSMADDGGSTGRLRDEIGVLPPGDIRRALLALSHSDESLRDLFNYRFPGSSGLAGHNFGNLFLTALEKLHNDFGEAVERAGRILNLQGEVAPVTLSSTRLYAKLQDGTIVEGEANIDAPQGKRAPIKEAYLEPEVTANPRATRAILEADKVVIGPGDLYTSIIPNLLVSGIGQALRETKAKVVYVVNLMTKAGETDDYHAGDFVRALQSYLPEKTIDVALINKARPSSGRLKEYKEEGARFVEPKTKEIKDAQVVTGDFLTRGGLVRHDPNKTIRATLEL